MSRTTDTDPASVSPAATHPVTRAVMVMEWNNLTFIHWRVDPDAVQRLLPDGLTVETVAGEAWVGLVPFEMRVTLPHAPWVPWLSSFPETNVRTYVRGPDGTTGVWFLSLDAARLSAVATARATYRLPYFWSAMTVSRAGEIVTYTTRRRIPGPRGASSTVAVRIGDAYAPADAGPFEHWLTARWRLFSAPGHRVLGAWADHEIWPLHSAELLHCDDELVRASGLEPFGDPLVHWSPGVHVRVSLPTAIAR